VIVGVTSPDSAPLTITQVEVRVFSKKRMQGDLIQCGYEAGGELGSAIFPNLDSPSGPIPMDADGDGDRDGSLPGGRFVVKPGEFEWLTILADGTAGHVYELGFVFHMVVKGEQRTRCMVPLSCRSVLRFITTLRNNYQRSIGIPISRDGFLPMST
jgi:hypothetical protein